jgi:outer membrane receptor protein involved in Fe transport
VHSKNAHWQHFMKIGKGFHTNDSRVVSAEINLPETPISRFVPSAYGIDLGTNWSPKPRVMITSALWHLLSQQEFVYVGDEGIVEASGRSRRLGLDLGASAQINDGLFIFSDYTYTYSRSIEEPSGDNYIPLAPAHTFTGGFNYRQEKGISGGLRFVYLGDRPANTDYTIKAEGYFKIDANVQYEFKGNLTLALVIQNLLDTKWNEAQFATESRLAGESNSVEEIHFTPGIPFAPRLKFNYRF